MNDQQLDEQAIRERVAERLEKRREFYGHLITYISVNLLLWSIWVFTGPDFNEMPWPLWASFGWGIGIVSHAYSYYTEYGFLRDRNEDILQREVEREYARIYGDKLKNENKLKNDDIHEADGPIGIGADGELLYRNDHTELE